MTIDSEALRLAHEFVADPEARGHAIRAIRAMVGPKTAAAFEEAVTISNELIRLSELQSHGPNDEHLRNHMERVRMLETALTEIMKGAGAFSRDPLTHAENCIEDMKKLAREALYGIPDKKMPQLRTTYEPLTEERIEEMRTEIKGATTSLWIASTVRERWHGELDILCNMAGNALLYAEEIQRLRDTVPSAIGETGLEAHNRHAEHCDFCCVVARSDGKADG